MIFFYKNNAWAIRFATIVLASSDVSSNEQPLRQKIGFCFGCIVITNHAVSATSACSPFRRVCFPITSRLGLALIKGIALKYRLTGNVQSKPFEGRLVHRR